VITVVSEWREFKRGNITQICTVPKIIRFEMTTINSEQSISINIILRLSAKSAGMSNENVKSVAYYSSSTTYSSVTLLLNIWAVFKEPSFSLLATRN
jgi:hypothetical protein